MAKRVHFIAHGRVQGVFFRDFTRKQATSYGLTGWVKNTPNGKVRILSPDFKADRFVGSVMRLNQYTKVEGEVQGEEELVQKLLKDIDRGPPSAHVVKLEKEEKDIEDGEESFNVTH